MRKRDLVLIGLSLVSVFFLVYSPVSIAATPKTIELVFANPLPEKGWATVHAIKPWIDQVTKATKGRVKMNLYSNQTLVKQADEIKAVQSGIADVAWMYFAAVTPDLVPLNRIPSLPGLNYQSELQSAVVHQQIYEKFPACQQELSMVKTLFLAGGAPNILALTKKQVKKVDDIKGLKIRTAGGFSMPYIQALGATPVTMGVGDLYMSLQQGVIDGALINAEIIVSFRLYELLNHYMQFPFIVAPPGMIMNQGKWNGLPADVQKQIMSVSGMAATKFFGKNFFTPRNEAKKIIEKAGYQFNVYRPTAAESVQWAKPADTIRNKYLKDLEAKGKTEAKAVYDAAIKMMADYKE